MAAPRDGIDPATCLLTDPSECGGRKRCLKCPNASWSDAVETTGLLSVKLFGARGDGVADDSEAFRAALNATRCCGGCVFFPPGEYLLNSTVMVSGCVKGSTGGTTQAQSIATMPQSVLLVGPTDGGPPVAIIDEDDGVLLQDVAVRGGTMGVLIRGGAGVRFINVCESLRGLFWGFLACLKEADAQTRRRWRKETMLTPPPKAARRLGATWSWVR